MKILLDTHIFLWYISAAPPMPPEMLARLRDPQNDVYLSAVSIWEASVKYHLGKLSLPDSPAAYLPEQRRSHQITSLSLDELSVAHLDRLPALHRDPFDRMLICQALEHGMSIATVDSLIRQYDVACV
jgi:PIN domain nuclease of toxin-antitoxin system